MSGLAAEGFVEPRPMSTALVHVRTESVRHALEHAKKRKEKANPRRRRRHTTRPEHNGTVVEKLEHKNKTMGVGGNDLTTNSHQRVAPVLFRFQVPVVVYSRLADIDRLLL